MLYIHIPLCGSKCYYCDFYSVAARGVSVGDVVRAIGEEIAGRGGELNASLPSIYFGGGTPSLLAVEQVGGLIETARNTFGVMADAEITLEANPEQLNQSYLSGLRQLGVNRLSIGVQSFSDQRLLSIGRKHSAAAAIEAVRAAQQVGFDNISIDLMFGFSDMVADEWVQQLDQAFALGVQHLSAYQLSIEPRTLFARRGVVTADEDSSAQQYNMLCRAARLAGMEHYEISNFALAGCRSRHNGGYWMGQPYVGVGAAAHSFDGQRVRSWNVASLRDYLAGAEAEREVLSDRDCHNEFVMTRLRTADGFSIEEYRLRFARSIDRVKGLVVSGDRAYIAEENFFIADSIISDLFI